MAGDLIPPPSPAGRPEVPGVDKPQGPPAGEHAAEYRPNSELEAGSSDAHAEVAPRVPGSDLVSSEDDLLLAVKRPGPTDTPYRGRFRFQLGFLIGVAALAVGMTYVLATGGKHHTGPVGWSTWKPSSNDTVTAAQQIADHVDSKYRLDNGDQLVVAVAGPLEIASFPFDVVIRSAPTNGDLKLIQGNGVLYTLKGVGANGSISEGKASTDRHLLLRREALELALYTFRYIHGVNQVVTLLPPKPTDATAAAQTNATTATDPPLQALFYRSGDVSGLLKKPLTRTITSKTLKPKSFVKAEEKMIAKLTDGNLFTATFQQGQDARVFMILDKITE